MQGWDAVRLDEYCDFRDAFLGVAVAELARQRPASFATHALQTLAAAGADGSAAAAAAPDDGSGAWQRREACLFAATASVEVLLSRVLSPPGLPPPAGAAELAQFLPALLRAALAPPATASAAGGALLLRARCKLAAALAPFLAADPAAHGLAEAAHGVLACLPHAAPITATAALDALVHLSRRCAAELAAPPLVPQECLLPPATPERRPWTRVRVRRALADDAFSPRQASDALLDALLQALGQQLGEAAWGQSDAERRAALISACGRVVANAPAHAERFVAPFVSALTAASAALDGAAAGADAAATDAGTRRAAQGVAMQLVERLDDATAALAPLRPLPKEALLGVLSHLWPCWCGIAPAAVRAGVETEVLPALCRLAQEGLRALKGHFAPLLPQTVATRARLAPSNRASPQLFP